MSPRNEKNARSSTRPDDICEQYLVTAHGVTEESESGWCETTTQVKTPDARIT